MDVADHERISRFLFFKRWFARQAQRVKPDAFIPHPYIELSVSCSDGLTETEIWKVGWETAEARSDGRPLLGRGDLIAKDFREQALHVDRDDIPKYHANVRGWPANGKDAQRMTAIELAARATLVTLD
jgi:hypothetical protein